jgi:branched-chain amino acid transport system substrate-binding protein
VFERKDMMLNLFLKRTCNLSLIFFIVLFTLILGCSNKEKDVSSIKIGFIGPLTGAAASYGVPQKNGAALAAEEINAGGGLNGKKIEIIFEDSQMDPNKAISAMKKLIDIDKVSSVIGETTTAGTLAIAETANKNKIVLISPSASGAKITDAGDYIFRISPSDSFQAITAAKLISETGLKKGAIVYTNDDWGVGIEKALREEFSKLGGTILLSEGCTPGTQDFRTQLVKIKALKPDFIYIPIHPAESAIFLRQVKELQVPGQIIGADNFSEKAILKTAGLAAEGVIFTMPTSPSGNEYEEFSKKYKAKFNEDASYSAAAAYDCVKILFQVMKEAGIKGEDIKNKLYSIQNFAGVSGKIGFDKNGDVNTKEFSITKIQKGDYIPYKKP